MLLCHPPLLLVGDICSFSYNRSFCFKQNVTWRHKYDVTDPVLTSYYVTISIWCQTVVFISPNTLSNVPLTNTYLWLVNLEYSDDSSMLISFILPILIFGFFGFKIGISDSEMNFLIINRLTCKGLSNQPRNYLVSVLCGQTCSRQVQSQFHPFANAFEFLYREGSITRHRGCPDRRFFMAWSVFQNFPAVTGTSATLGLSRKFW